MFNSAGIQFCNIFRYADAAQELPEGLIGMADFSRDAVSSFGQVYLMVAVDQNKPVSRQFAECNGNTGLFYGKRGSNIRGPYMSVFCFKNRMAFR